MARLFGLLLLIGVGWLIVRQVAGRDGIGKSRRKPMRFEKTVRCAHCGVHLPLSIARAENEHFVCSDPDCHGKR